MAGWACMGVAGVRAAAVEARCAEARSRPTKAAHLRPRPPVHFSHADRSDSLAACRPSGRTQRGSGPQQGPVAGEGRSAHLQPFYAAHGLPLDTPAFRARASGRRWMRPPPAAGGKRSRSGSCASCPPRCRGQRHATRLWQRGWARPWRLGRAFGTCKAPRKPRSTSPATCSNSPFQ
jgi:hypothetical protein